jgi:plasmid maintenance system killer protein
VDILFASTKLEKTLNSTPSLRKTYGADCGERIRRRLDDLRAAEDLEVVRRIPQMRCHELSGSREGQLAVDVKHPKRLVFEPAEKPAPAMPAGGLDWKNVRAIRILEVVDYHG